MPQSIPSGVFSGGRVPSREWEERAGKSLGWAVLSCELWYPGWQAGAKLAAVTGIAAALLEMR